MMNTIKAKPRCAHSLGKKGFELSINFIVMLILAIAVFGFGLFFVNKLFHQAGEIKAQLDVDTEKRIESMLDRGEKVAFPISSKDIKAGEMATFGLGIMNVNQLTTTFDVEIICSVATDSRDNEIANGCDGYQNWMFGVDPVTLEKNEKKVIPIAIVIPGSKTKGTYAFTVKVLDNGNIYGGAPKQIYVNLI